VSLSKMHQFYMNKCLVSYIGNFRYMFFANVRSTILAAPSTINKATRRHIPEHFVPCDISISYPNNISCDLTVSVTQSQNNLTLFSFSSSQEQ
jgi:hypothetical protein